MTAPTGPRLEMVLADVDASYSACATACIDTAKRAGVLEESLMLYGRPLTTRRLNNQLSEKKSFLIEGGGVHAHLARIADFRHLYVVIAGLPLEEYARRVSEAAPLVSSRWIDSEYDYWQNAADPLVYRVAGRSIQGLPLRSNNLPPPLSQMIVDVSRNPGRRILRDGYVEAVGYRMWLGEEFFRRVPGANREAIESTSWLKVVDLPGGMLDIIAGDKPFADGDTSDVQNRLRRLLFPTTAEL